MKIRVWKIALTVTSIVVSFICAIPEINAAERKLAGPELLLLLTEKTLRTHFPTRVKTMKMKENGEMIMTDYEGKRYSRTWYLEDSVFCFTNLKRKRGCFYIYELDSERYDLKKRKNGMSRGTVSFHQ